MTTSPPNSALPPITVSSTDAARLDGMIERLQGDRAEHVEALVEELERAEIVEPAEIPPNVVTMNSRVRFSVEGSSEVREMTLCFPADAGAVPDALSVLAPVGSALLGLSVGQEIQWAFPDGHTRRIRIEELVYQPERSNEL